MTWIHGFIICFSLAIVAACGMSPSCQPMMSKLGDLALVAISAASGNAMRAAFQHASGKRTNNKRKLRGKR